MSKELEKDPHDQLIDAAQANDLDTFIRILDMGLKNSSINLQHFFFEPHCGTILDFCCLKPGKSEFLKKLLSVGADVNTLNVMHNKYPIHLAAIEGHSEALKLLIEHPWTEVGKLDADKNSALYFAIKYENVECFKLLIECKDIDPNRLNKREINAVYMAATLTEKNDEVMLAIIRCPRVNVDKIVEDEPLRKTIIKEYPHLENELPAEGTRDIFDVDDEDPFLLYLYRNKIQEFISFINSRPDKVNCNDSQYTILQYACHYGLPEVVDILLDLDANPNQTTEHCSKLPICIASYRGFASIIELFLNSGKKLQYQTKDTNVLLEAAKGSICDHGATSVNVELCDHDRSIQLLLSVVSEYDINLVDFPSHYTCLHYAAMKDNCEVIFSLLDHGAYLGKKDAYGHSPLNEFTYNTLELYLNKCVTTNGLPSNVREYETICSYKFLCPPKKFIQKDNDNNQTPSTCLPIETQDIENIPETTPLLYITQIPELRPLLLHPVLTNFLDLKWNKIKLYFIFNLAFFAGFLLFLTTYIILTSHKEFDENNDTTDIDETIAYYLTLGFLIVLGFRESFQLILSPISYIKSIENWLEICLITLTSLLLSENLIIEIERVPLSAIVLLMSWSEMILLLGRHPMFAVQLEMFLCVTKNFARLLLWYSFIGLAFILSFNVLFYQNENFNSFFVTAFKTMIMVGAGELNAMSLPYGYSEIIGHLLIVLFVFFITLVLLNLLSGVAVSDTQAINTDANILVLISRINYIYSVEIIANSETHLDHFKKRLIFTNPLNIIKPFLKGLRLFPEVMENPKIKVLPNQKNLIDFGQSMKGKSIKCFPNFLGNYSDKEAIEKTKAIIELNSEKPKKTVEEILKEFIEKLNSLESAVNGVKESVKSRCCNELQISRS